LLELLGGAAEQSNILLQRVSHVSKIFNRPPLRRVYGFNGFSQYTQRFGQTFTRGSKAAFQVRPPKLILDYSVHTNVAECIPAGNQSAGVEFGYRR